MVGIPLGLPPKLISRLCLALCRRAHSQSLSTGQQRQILWHLLGKDNRHRGNLAHRTRGPVGSIDDGFRRHCIVVTIFKGLCLIRWHRCGKCFLILRASLHIQFARGGMAGATGSRPDAGSSRDTRVSMASLLSRFGRLRLCLFQRMGSLRDQLGPSPERQNGA